MASDVPCRKECCMAGAAPYRKECCTLERNVVHDKTVPIERTAVYVVYYSERIKFLWISLVVLRRKLLFRLYF
jgi:hypothetical protein